MTKARLHSGISSSSPSLMFALAGVLGDSSVAKPLIGAASPGNPNYRPWRDGCAFGGELNCAASLHLTGLPLQYRRLPPRGARDVVDKPAGRQGNPHIQQFAPNLVNHPGNFTPLSIRSPWMGCPFPAGRVVLAACLCFKCKNSEPWLQALSRSQGLSEVPSPHWITGPLYLFQ